jgi:hypothetical protein
LGERAVAFGHPRGIHRAVALRDAHRRLAGLTPEQMKAIAVEARREYE